MAVAREKQPRISYIAETARNARELWDSILARGGGNFIDAKNQAEKLELHFTRLLHEQGGTTPQLERGET